MPAPTLVKEDKQAMDWLTQNSQDPRAAGVAQKLGVDSEDIKAWDFTQKEPDHGSVNLIKNKLFLKIAEKRPAINEQGVSNLDRFLLKNIVDNEPKVQETYLQRKGFDTRIVDNNVEVKRPDETEFKRVDPKGFDLFDVTDLAGDVLEGITDAVATGAKFMGFMGAPATGGASIAAGSAVGGAVSGAFEAGRQVLGKELGVRDEINPTKIMQSAALGAAVPVVMKGLSKATGAIGEGIKKIRGFDGIKLKPDSEAVKAAAAKIGATPTAGQLYDSKLIQQLESSLNQSQGTLGGRLLRKQIDTNYKVAKEAADNIVESASNRTGFESGSLAKDQLKEEYANIIKPAEAIYNKYEALFASKEIKPNLEKLTKTIGEASKEILDPEARSILKNLESDLIPSINNLDSLKQVRTLVGKNLSQSKNPSVKEALGRVYGSLTDMRSDAIITAGKTFGNEDIAETVLKDITTADSLYRGAAEDLQSTMFRGGKKIRGGLKSSLEDFLNKSPEIDLINKTLKVNDPAKIAQVQKVFPQAFETLRSAKVSDIAIRSETKGALNPGKLAKNIASMPPETQVLLFGENAAEKSQALKKFLDSVPEKIGPSGTPEGNFFNMTNAVRQLKAAGTSLKLNAAKRSALEKDVFSVMTKFFNSQTAPAFGVVAGRQFVNDGQDMSQFNQGGLRLPNQNIQQQPQGLRLPQGAR